MFNKNSGYVGRSMSVRAHEAYENDLKPLSKIKKDDLLNNGIDISLDFFKFLCKEGYINSNEWHHTSKCFNMTDFYDLKDIKKNIKKLDFKKLEAEYREYKNEKGKPLCIENLQIVFVDWYELERSGGKWNRYDYNEYGVLCGEWIYIRDNMKKSINKSSLNYRVVEENLINKTVYENILVKLKILDKVTSTELIPEIISLQEEKQIAKEKEVASKKLEKQKKEKEKEAKNAIKLAKKLEKENLERLDTSKIKLNNIYKKIILLFGFENFAKEDMPLNMYEAKLLLAECILKADSLKLEQERSEIFNEIITIKDCEKISKEELPSDLEACKSLLKECRTFKTIDAVYNELLELGFDDLSKDKLGNSKITANKVHEELSSKMRTWKGRNTLITVKKLQDIFVKLGVEKTLADMNESTGNIRKELYHLDTKWREKFGGV